MQFIIYIEDEEGRDNPPDPSWRPGCRPTIAGCRSERSISPRCTPPSSAMRRVSDAYPDKVMIGEAYLPIDRLMAYYGADLTGFHLPFNFHLISTRVATENRLRHSSRRMRPRCRAADGLIGCLGNHDRPRVASRIGAAQARVAAMLLLTLRGTPTIYQGEEIGMQDVAIPPDQVQDPFELNVPGFGLGRDPVRTPMPWTSEPHGGFTRRAARGCR